MVFALSFVSAVFFAAGYVLQYHEAHEAPSKLFLSPKLLLELAKHKIWLGGIAAMFIGDGLQAVALDRGSLAVIEPILTASLLFALPISAAWRRERLRLREWGGAIAVSAGLGVLLAVGSPTPGRSTMPSLQWILVTLCCWGVALGMVAAARRLSHAATQASLIGAAAGILFGLQDALTRYCLHLLGNDFTGLALSWQPYVLLITAVYGLTLTQSAYEAGPLPAALPPIAIGEPVAGMMIGMFAFGERLSSSPVAMGVEAAAAVVMLVGAWALARSPLVCGRRHPSRLHVPLPHLTHHPQRDVPPPPAATAAAPDPAPRPLAATSEQPR
jgi:drug/metabolite transporter (DMT)-like permease